MKTNLLKLLFIVCGSISLLLGVIGMFLPLLPTTPFLLLASACFLRSSERLYRFLTGNRYLGTYLIAYQDYRAIAPNSRVVSLLLLWTGIIVSGIFATQSVWIQGLLLIIAIGVSVHLMRLKRLTAEMVRDMEHSVRYSRSM